MSKLTHADRIALCFAGGHLRRWHVADIISDERVDSHTWGMVMLIFILHPNPSIELVGAAQFHDAGEIFVGDIAHPAKVAIPGLGQADKEIGARWATATGLEFLLDADEAWWLTFVDSAQAYLFAQRQVAMGNRLMVRTMQRIHDFLEALAEKAPPNGREAWPMVKAVNVMEPVTRTITHLEEGIVHG